MNAPEKTHVNYFKIWIWLVALTVGYLFERWIGISRTVALLVIFGIALVKAALVAIHFMHLRHESRLIYAIILVPIALFVILVALLLPDITFVER